MNIKNFVILIVIQCACEINSISITTWGDVSGRPIDQKHIFSPSDPDVGSEYRLIYLNVGTFEIEQRIEKKIELQYVLSIPIAFPEPNCFNFAWY